MSESATQYTYKNLSLHDLEDHPVSATRLWVDGKLVAQADPPNGVYSTMPGFGAAIPTRTLPECFYVVDGADFCEGTADFTISWTELPGIKCKPMSIAKIIDAAMTRDFIEHGPALQVAAPLPVFEPKRAKPAIAGLMVEHDGRARGIGFCAGD